MLYKFVFNSYDSRMDNECIVNYTSKNTQVNAINAILDKALSLRGYTLGQLTHHLGIISSKTEQNSLTNKKGLTGQIIEFLLGATAHSQPIPDFPHLNLEVKTLPIDLNGCPLETTYICTAPLLPTNTTYEFIDSVVYKKIQHILWLPIIVPAAAVPKQQLNFHAFNDRIIGNAFLWQPSKEQMSLIKTDWQELTEMIITGNIGALSSHYGKILQIRPKAANSKVITSGVSSTGDKTATLPRGFYLRTEFTKEIYRANSFSNIF